MNNAIYKYPLILGPSVQLIQMPEGAEILHVATQLGRPTRWARVDVDAPLKGRAFAVCGTGQPCPADGYLGTTHADGFVWHIFEEQQHDD